MDHLPSILLTLLLAPLSMAARVVNEDNCEEMWSGQLNSDYSWSNTEHDIHGIEVELENTTTVHINTCGSSSDTFVQIRDEFDSFPIAYYDSDNCGNYNEHLSVELEAGRYQIEVGGHYSWGIYSYSLEVSIDCNGSSDDSGEMVFIGDGLDGLTHPDAATLPVVTEEDCSYLWEGHLWSHHGWNSVYTESGEIGLTLTESTVTNISTCGSDGDVFVYIYEVEDGITRDYGMWNNDSCGGGDDVDGYSPGSTQDISIMLLPGHYTIGVAGNDFQGEMALLEVNIDECGESERTRHFIPQYVMILIAAAVAVTCCTACMILAFVYVRNLCCFKRNVRTVRIATPRLQNPSGNSPKWTSSQVAMAERCVY